MHLARLGPRAVLDGVDQQLDRSSSELLVGETPTTPVQGSRG
ncbi:hypothetical protein [Cellulomonas chengniuliangii]|uniref:Uncharacterized protein n=1 Tax=Cellulomonas chengniuliangii TaxID=2968084 RepID=A0ABY5KY99_9CELL|nr:hypothetical protein [Cellulomonas chengniuliangii]UUI75481.1 hypothetical protein NP064_00670 [Cellulomonas chengniuliangii]